VAKLRRRTRQRLSLGIQYALFAAVVTAVALTANWTNLRENFFRTSIAAGMFPDVITVALRNTVIYTLLAFAFGLTLGLLLALMRLSKVAPYRWLATAYIELFRGLPALLVLFMVGYGFPQAFPDRQIPGDVYGKMAIGLGLVAAAYMAETLRAGIQAVPRGQLEAARTLGMSQARAMRTIVLPQAFRIVIPPMTNEVILLTKDSSLAFLLGVTATNIELTKLGSETLNDKANATPIIVAGLCYLIITLPLSQLVRRLELRYSRAR
jgi:polar amino acid transport system permease protein